MPHFYLLLEVQFSAVRSEGRVTGAAAKPRIAISHVGRSVGRGALLPWTVAPPMVGLWGTM